MTPPGLDLYRPHAPGSAALQVEGGASGAVIVAGMARVKPEVAGLPERVLLFREQVDEPDRQDGERGITLNFMPVAVPDRPLPLIRMRPGGREFWRVANAGAQLFLALQVRVGDAVRPVRLVALDGVPLDASRTVATVALPPGGRAEFVVGAPAAGEAAQLWQAGVDTGPTGPDVSAMMLARIEAVPNAALPPALADDDGGQWKAGVAAALADLPATARRQLYFAEAPNGTRGPTRYLLAVAGTRPRVFDPGAPPVVVTRVGAVEDWTIVNRTGELQAFRVEGMRSLEQTGAQPVLRDVVLVPAWRGVNEPPRVRVRLDFRDQAAGLRVAEGAILRHAEGGAMIWIRIGR